MYMGFSGPGNPPVDSGIDLIHLWSVVWQCKWQVIVITTLVTAMGVVYALTATERYRAEVTLMPVKQNAASALAGQLGGLAALAGMPSSSDSAEAIAVLRSRDFTRIFIREYNLLEKIATRPGTNRLSLLMPRVPDEAPDIRDAVRFFRQNVLHVQEDRASRQVVVRVEWTSPEVAAEWANSLVHLLNERMRGRALSEAEANIEYLQSQLVATSLLHLQESIGRLLENEFQTVMLARGSDEFAFRVIDPAEVPKLRAWPKRRLIVMIAMVFGGVLSLVYVLTRHAFKNRSARHSTV